MEINLGQPVTLQFGYNDSGSVTAFASMIARDGRELVAYSAGLDIGAAAAQVVKDIEEALSSEANYSLLDKRPREGK